MSLEFLHPELIRFAFVMGICVSILFYDSRHLTTGGIAVPAYLSLTIFYPYLAPVVFAVALFSFTLVHVLAGRFFILPARLKFSLLVIIASACHLVLDLFLQADAAFDENAALLRGIGYVVPGLIAHDFSRHGIAATSRNILLTSAIVAAALFLVASLMPVYGRVHESAVVPLYPVDLRLLPLLVFLSLIGWYGLTRVGRLRCGGVLGGAFMTLLVLQPVELLLAALTAAATILVVRYLVEPCTITFGRRRFAAHLIVGACLSWALSAVREACFGGATIATVTPSLAVVGVLLAGLLASDAARVGLVRTAAGIAGCVGFTLSGVLFVTELLQYGIGMMSVPFLIACILLAFVARLSLVFLPPRRVIASGDLP